MGLPKNIKDKANELALENLQDELVAYFTQVLGANEATFEDVLSYAKRTYVKEDKKKRYALSPESINSLALIKENKLSAQFYHLAAERDSPWGCINYARRTMQGRGIEQSINNALSYSSKALKLAVEKDTKDGVKVYERVFDLWLKNLEKNTDFLKENSDSVTAFLDVVKQTKTNRALANSSVKVSLLSGQLLEILNKPKKAWKAYSISIESTHELYGEIIEGRKKVLIQVINEMFSARLNELGHTETTTEPSNTVNTETEELSSEDSETEELSSEVNEEEKLLKELKISSHYATFWRKDSDNFHSVNARKLDELHQFNQNSLDDREEELNSALYKIKPGEEKDKLMHQRSLIKLIQKRDDEQYSPFDVDSRVSMRSHKAESRFFDPWHFKKAETLKSIQNLVLKILEQRFSFVPNKTSLSLEGISSRTLICAERVFQEALRFLGVNGYTLGIPTIRQSPWDLVYISGTNKFGPVELYQVGSTVMQSEHRTDPKPDRLGDCFVQQLGSYTWDIYPFFQRITTSDSVKEQLVAEYLIRYSKEHQPITLEELQKINPQSEHSDVDKFNRIAFLVKEREQAQWHSARNTKLLIGMSTVQAKALILIKEGWLTLADVFSGSDFSVYSHTSLVKAPDKLLESCKKIESLYAEFMLRSNQADVATFFKKQVLAKEERRIIPTRQQARKALQVVYGGESDSDGEGYDSELEFS